MNRMSLDGYEARIEYDEDAELFHGEIINLRDVITFQGHSVGELKTAFADSLADYLAFCKERGEAPEKPYSGQFVVRIDPALHRTIANAAHQARMSLNKWVATTLERAGNNKSF
jgi:predicted HicB family RNase H-like nuclease